MLLVGFGYSYDRANFPREPKNRGSDDFPNDPKTLHCKWMVFFE